MRIFHSLRGKLSNLSLNMAQFIIDAEFKAENIKAGSPSESYTANSHIEDVVEERDAWLLTPIGRCRTASSTSVSREIQGSRFLALQLFWRRHIRMSVPYEACRDHLGTIRQSFFDIFVALAPVSALQLQNNPGHPSFNSSRVVPHILTYP
jgi:hypothetical protein